jgi:hypothetical protein
VVEWLKVKVLNSSLNTAKKERKVSGLMGCDHFVSFSF